MLGIVRPRDDVQEQWAFYNFPSRYFKLNNVSHLPDEEPEFLARCDNVAAHLQVGPGKNFLLVAVAVALTIRSISCCPK